MGLFKKILIGSMNAFLKVFGDLKIFPWPFFLIYDPGSYRVKGEDIRDVIQLARPGDILLRGYYNYLDGYFIPGYFSHVGLYLGEITEADKTYLPTPAGEKYFRTGEQIVAHAMAEGVFMEDLINFCRCDVMAILRFPETIFPQTPVPVSTSDFTAAELALHERLQNSDKIPFSECFSVLLQLALGQVGKPYDFQFNFKNYNNMSCTEFVYFCIKSLELFHQLSPRRKRFLIFDKTVLTPDAFLASPLERVWQSRSVDLGKLSLLKNAK